MKHAALIIGFAIVAAACGGGTTSTTAPPEDSSSDSAEIYAAAMRQMVVDDNTFGGGGNPFSELLLRTSLDPDAGGPEPAAQLEVRLLSDGERTAIEAALSPIAPIRWIDNPDEWRTDDLMPVIEGSAILGVGPITFDEDGALVPMSMWCGGLCGTWFTYRAAETTDGWTIVDVEGPIAVS